MKRNGSGRGGEGIQPGWGRVSREMNVARDMETAGVRR